MDKKLLIENRIADIDRNATDRQREAGELYLRAISGDIKAKHTLSEGISTSDIPELLAPAINVQFLAQYADYPTVWQEIVDDTIDSPTLGNIEFGGFDFDTSALLGDHDGDTYTGMGLPGVGEYGEYPAVSFTTEQLEAELRKNGVRLRVSWETLVKLGNFDIIGRSTRAFARYASEQEDVALAKVFTTVAGVLNPDFTTITGNPDLSITALETAIGQAQALQVGGRPVGATQFRLVVPTTLSQTARNILSITRVEETIAGLTFDRSTNYGGVGLTVFPAFESVGNYTTPGTVNDNWFLVAQGTARPALAEVFLEGYRTPLISIKDSGHFSLGGGIVPSREGSFEIDDVETRGRHVVGAAAIEPSLVLKSDGGA
jgi:hypothetical protein